jgi:hypothetical protein
VCCNTVARSCNHCCYENATTHFLCIVDLHVAVNNMKLLTVTMETQEWAPFALLLIYEILPTAVNSTYEVISSCETPDVFVWFQPHLENTDQFSSKSPTSNLTKIFPVGNSLTHADGQTWWSKYTLFVVYAKRLKSHNHSHTWRNLTCKPIKILYRTCICRLITTNHCAQCCRPYNCNRKSKLAVSPSNTLMPIMYTAWLL